MSVSHQSRGIYRTRAEVAALRERVLDGWAKGLETPTLAERCGIDAGYVSVLIRRARAKGDPRAERRYVDGVSRAPYRWASQHDRIVKLDAKGYAPLAIARIVGASGRSVEECLSRGRLAA